MRPSHFDFRIEGNVKDLASFTKQLFNHNAAVLFKFFFIGLYYIHGSIAQVYLTAGCKWQNIIGFF